MKRSIGTKMLLLVVFLSGCTTYHITTKSLLEQFAEVQPEKKVNLIIAYPYFFFPGIVNGNSLTQINVLDEKDSVYILPVNHNTSVRITKKDGKRKTFYFDTMLIQDSIITGKNDHFIGTNIKPIKLCDVEKIELQKH